MDVDSLYINLGSLIRQYRGIQGFTQTELAKKTNLSRASITNIEKGRQKIYAHQLYIFAQALDIPIAHLLPNEKLDDIDRKIDSDDMGDNTKKWIKDVLAEAKKEK